MSAAAIQKLVQQMKRKPDRRLQPDDRVILLLMADRADDAGKFSVPDDTALYDELANEVNAVNARFRGDPSFVFGIDNDRVNRVIAALREINEE